MAGIKETKELAGFTLTLVETGIEYTEQGWSVIPENSVKLISEGFTGISGADEILAELEDLDTQEREELKAYVQQKFELEEGSELLEELVENSYEMAFLFARQVSLVKQIRAAKATE